MIIGIDARELQGRPTGVARYLRNLLRVWARTTDDRLVAYFNGPAPADPVLDHPRILRRSLGETTCRGLVWLESRLPAAARDDRLDVFFAPGYTCPLSLRTPRVVAVHDLSFYSLPEDFALLDGLRRRILVGASLTAARAILACSDFTRREIVSHRPELAGRVVHVPLGPDDDLSPAPPRDEARARLGSRGPLLLTVGAILNRRRLPDLLHATARLTRAWPLLSLDVVGENRTRPHLDLTAMARSLGLGERVRFSGFVSETALADRYAGADVGVFLSEYEGFGLPALEAMSRGLPVLTSTRPSLGEIFGPAALLVEPRDTSGIVAALDRLLREPSLRADLVARGRTLASRFSWARTAARTREVLAAAAAP